MRGLVDTPLVDLIAMGERLGLNTAVVVRPVELSTLGLGLSSGYLGKHVGIVSGDDFFC
jgi:hypothetical protein